MKGSTDAAQATTATGMPERTNHEELLKELLLPAPDPDFRMETR